MKQIFVTIQNQAFFPDVSLIERLLGDNPGWGRTRLSVKLCELWDWRAPNGQLKDMACRNLLLRLEQAGQIRLPPRQRKSTNAYRNRSPQWIPHPSDPIEAPLKELLPLQITCVGAGCQQDHEMANFRANSSEITTTAHAAVGTPCTSRPGSSRASNHSPSTSTAHTNTTRRSRRRIE